MADGLKVRIAKALAGSNWPSDNAPTTFGGSLNAEFLDIERAFFSVKSDREAVLSELDEFDASCVEFATALSILSDEAVHSEDGSIETFHIESESQVIVDLLETLTKKACLHQKVMGWARTSLKYGDAFLQPVVVNDPLQGYCISRVTGMPVHEMSRQEDPKTGLLLSGDKPETSAFLQTRNCAVIGMFLPWQIVHLRWMRDDAETYGRSLGYTARVDWRKLKAIEEALVINWLTRAFARLLFSIDVTGLDPESAKKYVDKFKADFLSKKRTQGDVERQASTVIKDIFLGRGYLEHGAKFEPSLTDVKVLDMSNTGFSTLAPAAHYQTKILIACQVPKAFMGLEKDVNAKATLTEQARRFARTVRRIQSLLTEALIQIFDIELILRGFDPRVDLYHVVWPNPSRLDEADAANIELANAKTDAVNIELGVYDSEWVAKTRLKMTDEEWVKLKARIAAAITAVPAISATPEKEMV